MPRFGTLDVKSRIATAPALAGVRGESWQLKGARILNLSFEVEDAPADSLLPPAMHPSIPSYALFNVTEYPQSPVGPFAIAEVRIVGRAGIFPRGFTLRSFVNNAVAGEELSKRWGYPVAAGEVGLEIRHDRIIGVANANGRTALEIELTDRETITPGDVLYYSSMHLARGENGAPLLVQVEPDFTILQAERGRALLRTFEVAAWGVGNYLRVTNPMSASFTICDVTIPPIRYACDPERAARESTVQLAA